MFRCKKINNTCSNPGSPIQVEYKKSFSKSAKMRVLVGVGKVNLYEKIQSYIDDNNVYKLLEKYNNDKSKLIQVQKGFADLKSAPTDINGLNEAISNYQNSFESLPADLKARFGNNSFNFISELGSDKFNEKLDEFYKSINLSADNKAILNNSIGRDTIVNTDVKNDVKTDVKTDVKNDFNVEVKKDESKQ